MLEHIPDRLKDLFDNVLERSEINSHFLLAMQWAIFVTTPLKPEQLYYAIMSGTGQLDSNTVVRNSRIIDHTAVTAFILASSRGLLEETSSASAGNRRVQFIHESAREYMLTHGIRYLDPSIAEKVEARSHERLAKCSQNYLRHVFHSGFIEVAEACTSWRELQRDTSLRWPFLDYELDGALMHAEAAAKHGVPYGLDHNVPLDH